MTDGSYIWPIVLACVWFPAVAILWKHVSAIQAMAGQRTRAIDRERRDQQDLVLRLIEKRDSVNLPETERRHLVHANEHMRIDASMEQEAERTHRPPTAPTRFVDEFCSPEEAVSD